jgi:hypothetical protein
VPGAGNDDALHVVRELLLNRIGLLANLLRQWFHRERSNAQKASNPGGKGHLRVLYK